jgi:hypothetical protein
MSLPSLVSPPVPVRRAVTMISLRARALKAS